MKSIFVMCLPAYGFTAPTCLPTSRNWASKKYVSGSSCLYLPPGIWLRHKSRRHSMNSFQRLEFSFTHVLSHGSKGDYLHAQVSWQLHWQKCIESRSLQLESLAFTWLLAMPRSPKQWILGRTHGVLSIPGISAT